MAENIWELIADLRLFIKINYHFQKNIKEPVCRHFQECLTEFRVAATRAVRDCFDKGLRVAKFGKFKTNMDSKRYFRFRRVVCHESKAIINLNFNFPWRVRSIIIFIEPQICSRVSEKCSV